MYVLIILIHLISYINNINTFVEYKSNIIMCKKFISHRLQG